MTVAEIKLVDIGRRQGNAPANTRKELETQVAYIRQSKADHHYSPAVGQLYDLALSYVEYVEDAARQGKRAAWVMGIWDSPLMYALDIIPISLTELGRLGSNDAMAVAEDYFQLPKETCSMVASVLGEWYLRRDFPVKDIVAFNGVCEPLNMGWELIEKEGFRVFRIEAVNRPLDNDPRRLEQNVSFLAEELADLAIQLTGKPVDLERVAVEIQRANRILRKNREVFALREKNPLYIKSLATMFLLMGSGHYFGRPEEYEAALDLLIAELKVADFVPAPGGREIVPLAWVGGRGQEFGVYKAVDDCGGAVVTWYTPNPWSRDWPDERASPLENIALHVLTGRAIGSPVHRLNSIEKAIARYGAKGILFYGYVGCSFGGIYNEIQRDHFHQKGIPSISLEGSFQVGPPSGQLLTRVRAFVEMLSR